MTDMHAKAVEAACLAEHGDYWSAVSAANQFVYRARMSRNIAAFLRAVEPSEQCTTNEKLRLYAKAFAKVTADELDGGQP